MASNGQNLHGWHRPRVTDRAQMAASRTCPETVQMVQTVHQREFCYISRTKRFHVVAYWPDLLRKTEDDRVCDEEGEPALFIFYDVSKTASLPSGNRNRANDLWTDMMFFFCEHLMKCYEKNGTRGSTSFLTAWRATGISSFPVVPNSRSFAAPDSYVLPPPCLSFSRTASCPPAC